MSVVVPLKRDALSRLTTLGEVVEYADAVPEHEIQPKLLHHLHEIERLTEAGEPARSDLARQFAMVGVLANRMVFEIYNLPKRHSAAIDAAVNTLAKVATPSVMLIWVASTYLAAGAVDMACCIVIAGGL